MKLSLDTTNIEDNIGLSIDNISKQSLGNSKSKVEEHDQEVRQLLN